MAESMRKYKSLALFGGCHLKVNRCSDETSTICRPRRLGAPTRVRRLPEVWRNPERGRTMAVKALVVDDSSIMRKMVMRTLARSNLAEFDFLEAKDGVAALEVFQQNPIDVVFVDWNMPRMTGIEFVRAVRNIEKKHTPVVMITPEGTEDRISEAKDSARVDSYITKPFSPEDFSVGLKQLFSKLVA